MLTPAGRMTLIMETTKTIVAKDPVTKHKKDGFEREPFLHPSLQSVDNLSHIGAKDIAGKTNLSTLAADVGLIDVVRWKPRKVWTRSFCMFLD